MMKSRSIQKEAIKTTACPFCDGCEKIIETPTFLRWTFHPDGEDDWAGYEMVEQLDSHDRLVCIGKVMAKIFSQ